MGYLSNAGLSYFFGKLKTIFAPISHGHGGATQSAAGFMSAADKKKLDGIAEGANKYSLPTATSNVLGGVKTGANITSNSGVLSVTAANVTNALGYTPPKQDTNTWRPVVNSLTSSAADQSLSAAQGKVLKGLVDGKAAASHTHSQYYDSTISRTKGTVLAAPASANGVATFRTLTKSDVGLSSVDNTADSAKSVKYATSAGSAGSATKANCVADYNATSKSIQIGYSGDGITGDAIKYIAGYTTGDGGDVSAKIKDISKDALKGWIGSLPANGGNSTTVNGHSINSDVPAGAKFTDTNTWRGIQDNLTSGSTTDSLSANQGKVLKGLIDGKAASGHTHNYAGSSSSGGAATSANKVNAALTINLNGTSQGAWDGSSAKSISITAASVGATSVTISRW